MQKLEDLLSLAQSSRDRKEAESTLEAFKRRDPTAYLAQLVSILSNEEARSEVRELAGLISKNMLKNASHEDYLDCLWQILPSDLKDTIRKNALETLASPLRGIRNSAAQTVAVLIGLDLPGGHWPSVLPILTTNASNPNPHFKEASLLALGYACEELTESIVSEEEVNKILTPIVGCMVTDSTVEIAIVAIKALRNSLKFISPNMNRDHERAYIVNAACRCSQHSDPKVRYESLQVLCDCAYFYHDLLSSQLNSLGTVTFNCIRDDENMNVIMALEFWTIIAENEKLKIENCETPKGYIQIAYESLTDFVLDKINDYTEDDDDDWNVHKACGTLCSLMTYIVGVTALSRYGNYVLEHLDSADWKRRESAVLILGMIQEGMCSQEISAFLNKVMPMFLKAMNDPSVKVRHTSSWTLSKICEFHLQLIDTCSIMNILVNSLEDSQKVACHSCWAIICIFENKSYDLNRIQIELIIDKLLFAAYRRDLNNFELQTGAYSAVSSILEHISEDYSELILLQVQRQIDFLKISEQETMQGLICSCLQSAFSRVKSLSEETIREFLMATLKIFKQRQTVLEEGLSAISSLACVLETRFDKYMETLMPYLLWALNNTDSMALLKAGAACVCDLARALSERISFYIPNFLPLLLRNLALSNVSSDVKVQSIESLADLASKSKGDFAKYLPDVIPIILQAAHASSRTVHEHEDPDLFEYLLELREAILVFFTSLIQGLNDDDQASTILEIAPKIVDYALFVVQDQLFPTRQIKFTANGLIGDIARIYKFSAVSFVKSTLPYLQVQAESEDEELRSNAKYSISHIKCLND